MRVRGGGSVEEKGGEGERVRVRDLVNSVSVL